MLTISRQIDAPAAAVWKVLCDTDAWPKWGPTVSSGEIDGGTLTLGATGRVYTPVGVALPFTIIEFEPGRHWKWAVAGVPATAHGVEPTGTGCRATMSAPWWAPAYLPVLAIALQRIDRMVS
ncbi:SRPBCC family protein [Mycobacterium sp. 1274761.0]|uniref:SRPBCC family protein n=1 Tax=Mycobacterium sp. 1274761.0 TaxID=1834077 RepID=UPI0007FE0825|nr:SRPBCC family protein [Mycobacterium sp. 1274761.0]OBK71806.1 polyketide cyclase [Mycobacterium sp. 1274761.0]